jgi:HEAT repeat protein
MACTVPPLRRSALQCSNILKAQQIRQLLRSRERTQRFTAVKLARLLGRHDFAKEIRSLSNDPEEDIYVRLEACCYLASVCNESARHRFSAFLATQDEQGQLEVAIALGEVATPEAVELLCELLGDSKQPFFLRSAAAWSLGISRSKAGSSALVKAFADVDNLLRTEALEALAGIGEAALPALLDGLRHADESIGAGCAEALRQNRPPSQHVLNEFLAELRSPQPKRWAIWLVGNLPREQFATAIAELEQDRPELHFAISLLWSFVESWIAARWELRPHARQMERAPS